MTMPLMHRHYNAAYAQAYQHNDILQRKAWLADKGLTIDLSAHMNAVSMDQAYQVVHVQGMTLICTSTFCIGHCM